MKLTEGEKLFIVRRRAGHNQYEMSILYGVCESVYSRWELDKTKRTRDIGVVGFDLKCNGLKGFERCVILRRRDGMTQNTLAALIGVDRVWVNRMETGKENWEKLKEYWDNVE